jgi:hypothetical protein
MRRISCQASGDLPNTVPDFPGMGSLRPPMAVYGARSAGSFTFPSARLRGSTTTSNIQVVLQPTTPFDTQVG